MSNESHSSHSSRTAPNLDVSYEEKDININWVLVGAGALFILTVVAMIISSWFFTGLDEYRMATDPTPLPLIELRPTPPAPRLQPNPIDRQTAEQDLIEMQATEEAALNSYGWVDQEEGIIRIPIDQALEILVEQEEPAR